MAISQMTALSGVERWWPWVGVAAAVLLIIATWAVQFQVGEDELDEGGAVLLEDLDSGSNEVIWRVTSGLGYVGVACLIGFAAGLRRYLDLRSGGQSILPLIIFAALLVTAGAMVVAWSFRAQVFDGIDSYAADPSSHVTINRLSQDTGLSAWPGMAAATAAAALSAFRPGLFPRWLGWLSLVATLLIVVMVMVGGAFPANIPAAIWLLAVSIWTVTQVGREGGPAADTRPA